MLCDASPTTAWTTTNAAPIATSVTSRAPPDQHGRERERHDRRGGDPRPETGEPPRAVEDEHGQHRLGRELRQAAAEDRPPGRVGEVL